MRGLALETSGRTGSVALVTDGARILAEDQFQHGLQHAAHLLPMIDRLCRAQGWTPTDIDELYVSTGPGSFTGLRIGITLAKTMAFATGVKLVAVPTLAVLAQNAPAEARHLILVLDAKRDQIFTARFEKEDSGFGVEGSVNWVEREPAHLDDLPSMLARSPRPVHLLGEGLPYHEKFIARHDPQVIVTDAETWRARASAVARIGYAMARRGDFADPFALAPTYIRKPEAEEKLERPNGSAP